MGNKTGGLAAAHGMDNKKSFGGFFDEKVMKIPINSALETKALFIGCMEKRLQTVYPIIMINLFKFQFGEFFKKTPAGAVNEIVYDTTGGRNAELNQIKLALTNGVRTIVICVHTDCAADGGSKKFDGQKNREMLHQWTKAEEAREIILNEFSEDFKKLKVELVLAVIDGEEVEIIRRVRDDEF